MLQLKNVCKDFGEKIVLDDISFSVYDGEHVGIVGANGVGKTTLLNIILGKTLPDSGQVVCDDTFGVLSQATTELNLDAFNGEQGGEFFKQLKQMQFDGDIDSINDLSCGEKTKVGLAVAFSQNPTSLVLDEPTNHLDIGAKALLIEQINNFFGTVIIVSHDVDFLNQTVNKIFEIADGKIKEYYGNYNDYLEQKQTKQLEVKRNYEKHKKQVDKINETIDKYTRYMKKADKNIRNQGGQKSDAKLMAVMGMADCAARSLSRFVSNRVSKLNQELKKDVEKPERQHKIKYALKTEQFATKTAVSFKDVKKSFDGKIVFKNLNFDIKNGDKLCIIGNNGTGKTTILNLILDKTKADKGDVFVAQSLKTATMFQDVYDLDEDKTINQISQSVDKQFRTDFITNLCAMEIDKTRFDVKIKHLSMGERMRIKLCLLILSDANVILLDEPTNHLDIKNKEYLTKVLADFAGTLVVVSHDIEFLKAISTKTLLLKDGEAIYFDDGVATLIEQNKLAI